MDALSRTLATSVEPPWDAVVFTALTWLYTWHLSRHVYTSPTERQPRLYAPRPEFKRYIRGAAVLGLLLPAGFLLSGLLVGGRHVGWAWRAAGPHLLLLVAQVVAERHSYAANMVICVRVLIPPLYNSRRMFTLYQWMCDTASHIASAKAEGSIDGTLQLLWLQAGLLLAVANFFFWGYNLFGFLLPDYVPDGLRLHFALHPNSPRSAVATLHEEAKAILEEAQRRASKKED